MANSSAPAFSLVLHHMSYPSHFKHAFLSSALDFRAIQTLEEKGLNIFIIKKWYVLDLYSQCNYVHVLEYCMVLHWYAYFKYFIHQFKINLTATYPLSFSSCMHATLLPSASTLPPSWDQEPCLWLSCGVLMKGQLMIRPNTPWTYRSCWKTQNRGEGGDDPVSLPNINTAILRKGSSGQHPPQGCPALLWMVRTQESEPRPSASPGGPRMPNTEQGTLLDLSCPQTTQTPKTHHVRLWVVLCDCKEGPVPRVKSSSRPCDTTKTWHPGWRAVPDIVVMGTVPSTNYTALF